jgi:5-methylcytosine-specific restriction endonuclease McrA
MPKAPPIHKPAMAKAPRHMAPGNRQRRRAMHTGSKGWRLLRLSVLQRDGYLCTDCGHFGDQVDHDDGDSHNNDPRNLKTRCIGCHSAKTRRDMSKVNR